MESLGLCFLTCSGCCFSCENVQSENLTWHQFLNDLALAVKSTSALQEQIFIVFSGRATKRFFIVVIIFLQEETLQRLCCAFSCCSRSDQQFSSHWSPLTLSTTPQKITPFSALSLQVAYSSREAEQKCRHTELHFCPFSLISRQCDLVA